MIIIQIYIITNFTLKKESINVYTNQKQKKHPSTECFQFAWQRPTLTGGIPQLPSVQKSLTTVFGMGTGVASSLLHQTSI